PRNASVQLAFGLAGDAPLWVAWRRRETPHRTEVSCAEDDLPNVLRWIGHEREAEGAARATGATRTTGVPQTKATTHELGDTQTKATTRETGATQTKVTTRKTGATQTKTKARTRKTKATRK